MQKLPSDLSDYLIFTLNIRNVKRVHLSIVLSILVVSLAILAACRKGEPEPMHPAGTLKLLLSHNVAGAPLVKNELRYVNAASNPYMITEVKYFISDIVLYRSGIPPTIIDNPKDIFYIDEDITSTKTIQVMNAIPEGSYDSIGFTFGIPEAKNRSYMFANPPESIMGWPEILGGGYHYMMMNGKWQDTAGMMQPFNFHLGVGQLYHGQGYNVDSIYMYVQNCFRVNLTGSSFVVHDKESITLRITMNIESWFNTPHVYDHNYWGGGIMQNQAAMQMARENGYDAFSCERVTEYK
jgi:hypothetical protein